jgi:hypothetical protein
MWRTPRTGLVKLDAGDHAAGKPFAARHLLQPADFDDRIGRHGLDVHRADDVIVCGIGAIVWEKVIARDQGQVAEHAVARRLILKPGIVVSAAQVPEVVVSVDDLARGHRPVSLSVAVVAAGEEALRRNGGEQGDAEDDAAHALRNSADDQHGG